MLPSRCRKWQVASVIKYAASAEEYFDVFDQVPPSGVFRTPQRFRPHAVPMRLPSILFSCFKQRRTMKRCLQTCRAAGEVATPMGPFRDCWGAYLPDSVTDQFDDRDSTPEEKGKFDIIERGGCTGYMWLGRHSTC